MATISGTALIAEVESLAKAAGDKYVWGGTGPTGYDCSGLIYEALTKMGAQNVPRTSEEQYTWATPVSANQIQPGDLVFANFGNEVSPGHVGIYIGNGQVFSARDPSSGIGIDTLSSWGSNIVGYGRIPNVQTSGPTGTGPTGQGTGGALGGLLSFPSEITGFFSDAKTFVDAIMWLVKPSSWLRIGSFFIGGLLILMAIFLFMKVGTDEPIFKMPQVVPIPV